MEMGKTIIIYFSHTGNTEYIADAMAEETGADVLRIAAKRQLNPDSFSKFIIGGFQVIFNVKPKLKEFSIDIENYENIILGTPVWARSFNPALNSFLSKVPLKNKNVAVFTCSFVTEDGMNAISKLKKAIPDNKFLGEHCFKEPIRTNEAYIQEAREWARGVFK